MKKLTADALSQLPIEQTDISDISGDLLVTAVTIRVHKRLKVITDKAPKRAQREKKTYVSQTRTRSVRRIAQKHNTIKPEPP